MRDFSEEFFQLFEKELDYQKIADRFLEFSDANFAVFNLYDEDGDQFTTMAIAGDQELIRKAMQILHIKVQGQKWPHDIKWANKINQIVTRFSSLSELAGDILPKSIIELLVRSFDIGELVVIRIMRDKTMLGDFTCVMSREKRFNQYSKAEAYSKQLGLVLTQRRTEHLLRIEQKRLKNIIEGTRVGTWEWNIQKDEIIINERWAEIIGYTLSEVPRVLSENAWDQFFHPEDLHNADLQLDEIFKNQQEYYDTERRMIHKNGDEVWVHTQGKVIDRAHNGKPLLMSGTHSDISHRKKMEQVIFNEKEQFKTTLLSIGDGVISTDNHGSVMIMNKIAEQLTGWTQEEACGKPLEEVFHIMNELTRERCENPVYKVLETGNIIELANHTILISRLGLETPIEDSAAPIKDEQGNINGVVLVFRDFTEKKEKRDKITYLSFFDQLTEIYNRRFFEEELKRLDTERNFPLTLAMLDVNGLKLINDAFGHLVGDEVLKRIAYLIKRECRMDDIIARIGGDEFVILLPKTDAKQTAKIMKRLHEVIVSEKVDSINLSISCGWATKEKRNTKIAAVFKKAEDNMYRQKLSESTSVRHKTIQIILKTLYEKNTREESHSKRVSNLCGTIGHCLDLSQEKISELITAGLLHDIGKIAINEDVLNKATKLNKSEWLEIQRHPEIGYRILSSVNEYASLAGYVLAHHERWDGKGYPKGLKGKAIPLQSRVIAVVDAYDAMTGYRPHQKTLSHDVAMEKIKRNAGVQFDPDIVKVFFEQAPFSEEKK